MRSETAEIAIELSMQPWNAFRPDGVIMFSDILTPLPAMGIEFDVVRGKGPIIQEPIRRCCVMAEPSPPPRATAEQTHCHGSLAVNCSGFMWWQKRAALWTKYAGCATSARDVFDTSLPGFGAQMQLTTCSMASHQRCREEQLRELRTLDDPDASLPFIRQILSALRANVGDSAAVLGFIGAPWTLAAYAVEGAADRWDLPRLTPILPIIVPCVRFPATRLLPFVCDRGVLQGRRKLMHTSVFQVHNNAQCGWLAFCPSWSVLHASPHACQPVTSNRVALVQQLRTAPSFGQYMLPGYDAWKVMRFCDAMHVTR